MGNDVSVVCKCAQTDAWTEPACAPRRGGSPRKQDIRRCAARPSRAPAAARAEQARGTQASLLAEATAFRDAHIVDVASYAELREAVAAGRWARGWWAGARPVDACTVVCAYQSLSNRRPRFLTLVQGFSAIGLRADAGWSHHALTSMCRHKSAQQHANGCRSRPGSDAAETQVKEETSATLRCIPFDQPGGGGRCLFSGEPATEVAVFAKSY